MNLTTHLSSCPIGSILVTYGDGTQLSGISGQLLNLAYSGIRKHQRALYPDSPKTDGTHIQIKVSHRGLMGTWVSATVPRVVEIYDPVGKSQKVRLYRYSPGFSQSARAALAHTARLHIGQKYDTLQLLGIATAEQKWIPKVLRHWLGTRLQLPGCKEVCSTLAHKALLAAWEVDGFMGIPRPLGNQDPFDTCPADFEHHETFTLITEQS